MKQGEAMLSTCRLAVSRGVLAWAVASLAACAGTDRLSEEAAMQQQAEQAMDENEAPMTEGRAVAAVGPEQEQERLYRELLERVGGRCKYPGRWDGCMAGDYFLELLPGCDAGAFYAGVVSEQGALLLDRAPPEDTLRRARLSKGQLVCIQAIARAGQEPAYYYASTVPASHIASYRDTPLYETYGDRPVQWLAQASARDCLADPAGSETGNCASGWVDSADLDVFSNGM